MAVPAKIHEAAQPKPPKERRLKISSARKERSLVPWEANARRIIGGDKVTALSLAPPIFLAETNERYQDEITALAARLAGSFRARAFDNTRKDREDPPFMVLEAICERLPLCADPASACVVLMASPYTTQAMHCWVTSCVLHARAERCLRVLAAYCVSRDVHDAAIAHGWSTMKERRGMP